MSQYVHQIGREESERIRRFLVWLAAGTVLFVLLVAALVVTADSWLRLVSPSAERRFIEPYMEWARDRILIPGDPALDAYVRDLAGDLVAHIDADRRPEIRVQVIGGDTVNAFATLGGYIFIHEGLLRALDDENALAMVVGHEIAHVHHRDPLLSTGRGMLLDLAISTLRGGSVDTTNVDFGAYVLLNRYSREQELAADRLALSLLAQRYGHVGGATSLFEIIGEDEDDSEAGRYSELLSTHPDVDARIAEIEARRSEMGWASGSTSPYPEAVRRALGR